MGDGSLSESFQESTRPASAAFVLYSPRRGHATSPPSPPQPCGDKGSGPTEVTECQSLAPELLTGSH